MKNSCTIKESLTEGRAIPLVKVPIKLKSQNLDYLSHNISQDILFSKINEIAQNPKNKEKKIFDKKKLKEILPHLKNKQIVVAQGFNDANKEYYNRYQAFDNYPQFIDLIKKILPKYRTFNEVLIENQPIKLVFDLEWMDIDDSHKIPDGINDAPRFKANYYPPDLTIDKFKQKLEACALNIFGKPIKPENYRILCSSRFTTSNITHLQYFKNSYHVIIANYGSLPNLSTYHHKFAQLLHESFQDEPVLNNRLTVSTTGNEKLESPVDFCVYKKNQTFRSILSTKPDRNSYLMPLQADLNRPISDFFIGWLTDNDPPLNINQLNIAVVAKTDKSKPTKIIPFIPTELSPIPPHLVEHVTSLLRHLKPDQNIAYDSWSHIAYVLFNIHPGLFDQFDQWSSNAPNYDQKSCQKKWNKLYQSGYSLKTLKNDAKQQTGFEPEPHIHNGYEFEYIYQNTPRNTFQKAQENNYWGAQRIVNQSDLFVNIDLDDLIQKIEAGVKTIILKAPCGSAKTDFYVKLVTLLSHKGLIPRNFLVVNALRTLAHSIQGRFMGDKKPYGWTQQDPDPKSVDLKFYTDLNTTEDLFDTNVNIVVNSLPKLADWGSDMCLANYQRDLLILDEWKSFLLNLCGQTLNGRRRQVISHLQYYIQNTKLAIFMDQNIDDDCLESIFQLRDPKSTIIYDYVKPNACDHTVYELSNLNKTLEILGNNYLSQGKLVYICSNAKKRGADMIYEYIKINFPDLLIKKYTSDTSDEDKSKLGNCEEEWITYVISSPSIVYGVDHSKEDVFHWGTPP